MVQAKHKKSKSNKKHTGPKKHGTNTDLVQFRSQLDILGLRIVQVTADGNCFFRALADQLEGNEEKHNKYRLIVVEYIMIHREEFEPFIEDEVPFDEYCQNMGKTGTWAGHMELQAASLVTRRNICIHRIMSPRWYIRNFGGHEANMIHLSYHDGEHYNSVRLKEDTGEGPAKPIIIKVDANISANGHEKKASVYEFKGSSHNFVDTGAVKLVIARTGCENIDKIKQVLQEVGGDLDAAVEFLIADREMIKDNNSDVGVSYEHNGENQNGKCEQPASVSEDVRCEGIASTSTSDSAKNHSGQQKTAKNKDCPCGSKKKYEACCGSAVRKSLPAPVNTCNSSQWKSKAGARKSKKGKKGNQKKEATREALECRSANPPPDLGALCI